MGLSEHWIGGWQYVKARAVAAYADLTLGSLLSDGAWKPTAQTRAAARTALRLECLAERMEALGHVLVQRVPVDGSAERGACARGFYTTKAVVALLLNRHGEALLADPVCVARVQGGAAPDEIRVPDGIGGWTFEMTRWND